MKFESKEEEKLFLMFVEEIEFYEHTIKEIAKTEEKQNKIKLLKEWEAFNQNKIKRPNEPITNRIYDFRGKIFASARQMEGNTPILWDLMLKAQHLNKILTDLYMILCPKWDCPVDITAKFLYQYLDFFEQGISPKSKKRLIERLTGSKFEELIKDKSK